MSGHTLVLYPSGAVRINKESKSFSSFSNFFLFELVAIESIGTIVVIPNEHK